MFRVNHQFDRLRLQQMHEEVMAGVNAVNEVRAPEVELRQPSAHRSTLAQYTCGAIKVMENPRLLIAHTTEEAAAEMMERHAELSSWNIASGLPAPNPYDSFAREGAASPFPGEPSQGAARSSAGSTAPTRQACGGRAAVMAADEQESTKDEEEAGEASADSSVETAGRPRRDMEDASSAGVNEPPVNASTGSASRILQLARNEVSGGESSASDSEADVPIGDRSMARAEARYSTFDVPQVRRALPPPPWVQRPPQSPF
jgi:hypothetical protein